MTASELDRIGFILDRFDESKSVEAQMNELLLSYAKRLYKELIRVQKLHAQTMNLGLLGESGAKRPSSKTTTVTPGSTTPKNPQRHSPPPHNKEPFKLTTNLPALEAILKREDKPPDYRGVKCMVLSNPEHEDRGVFLGSQIEQLKKVYGDFELERIVFHENVPREQTMICTSKNYYLDTNAVLEEIIDGIGRKRDDNSNKSWRQGRGGL